MIRIKDWEKIQSCRNDRGAPPWIKVHRSLLSNPKWAQLSDAEKGQIVSLWIVAADNNGELPDDPNVIRKMCQLDDIPDINKFKELGFLEDDSCQLSDNLATTCQPVDNQVATQCPQHDAKDTPRSSPLVPPSLSPAPQTLPPIIPPTHSPNTLKSEKSQQISAEFEVFWKVYPRKVGKGDARKKYILARKKIELDALISAVERYAETAKDVDPQYIPHPATWLSKERFFDEIPQQSDENLPSEDPDDIVFEGTVIRLGDKTFYRWLDVFGGNEKEFREFLWSKDQWYIRNPDKCKNWRTSTAAQINSMGAA